MEGTAAVDKFHMGRTAGGQAQGSGRLGFDTSKIKPATAARGSSGGSFRSTVVSSA